MKQRLTSGYRPLAVILISLLASILTFAQEKNVDININAETPGSGNFFTSPWVWIVGGAIFILLLVALMRGGSSKSSS